MTPVPHIMPTPIYLALPEGSAQASLAEALGGAGRSLPGRPGASDLAELEPGVVILDAASTEVSYLLEVAESLPPDLGGWIFAVADGGEPPKVRALSLGRPHGPDEVRGRGEEPDAHKEVLLEINQILKEVARARHDVNNPLTSALAETQLGLLDAPEGEIRESLEVVQTQLRRIRDLIAATGHLRPPKN